VERVHVAELAEVEEGARRELLRGRQRRRLGEEGTQRGDARHRRRRVLRHARAQHCAHHQQ
jgi:hypothetical protein